MKTVTIYAQGGTKSRSNVLMAETLEDLMDSAYGQPQQVVQWANQKKTINIQGQLRDKSEDTKLGKCGKELSKQFNNGEITAEEYQELLSNLFNPE